MGVHRTDSSLEVINFLLRLGEALGYYVQDEEPMFPGDNQSPILDITWRKHKADIYPLVIIEVETASTKAATDNVTKLFGERTTVYPKPLFFYHVFVETPVESRRVRTLRNMFGQHNYEAYSLIDSSHHLNLVSNILEQHFRVFETIDLLEFVEEVHWDNPLQTTVGQILGRLVEIGYDLRPQSNFLSELETLIVITNCPAIDAFYADYLPLFLSYNRAPVQEYPPDLNQQDFFGIVHWSVMMILGIASEPSAAFHRVQECEASLWGEPPHFLPFGCSMDGDREILSEWPLIFALLCLAFSNTVHAGYFSNKLNRILAAARNYFGFLPTHSLSWLAISAQLARDAETYNDAKAILDQQGGIPVELIRLPTLYSGFPGSEDIDPDWSELSVPHEMPRYGEWSDVIRGTIEEKQINLVACIIEAFLWVGTTGSENARRHFAELCMKRAIV